MLGFLTSWLWPAPNAYHSLSETYHIRRYHWRSLLTLVGPLIVTAFFIWICIYYLLHPPINDIVTTSHVDGNWVFYAWFIISIFVIDWARTGLANLEACALMHPWFAPVTAVELMWHADGNWANPLWWLRAIRAVVRRSLQNNSTNVSESAPSSFWFALSLIMLLLFTAIPLSSLAFQNAPVLSPSQQRATIRGYDIGTLGFISRGFPLDDTHRTRAAWQSGQEASPRKGGYLYAPASADNVSRTYYDDQASSHASYIETFVAPAVREEVTGRAYGFWANVSCNPVPTGDLLLLRSDEPDQYTIDHCLTNTTEFCDFKWTKTSQIPEMGYSNYGLPLGMDLSSYSDIGEVNYSMYAVADGAYSARGGIILPGGTPDWAYACDDHHDKLTLDHFKGRPLTNITTGALEVYLWQSRNVAPAALDPGIQLFAKHSPNLVKVEGTTQTPWFGFNVHCDVTSAVGFATLDPAHRTFSNFTRHGYTNVPGFLNQGPRFINYFEPLQIQALLSFFPTATSPPGTFNRSAVEIRNILGNWRDIHQSLNSEQVNVVLEGYTLPSYPLLTPPDLQRSLYKLLGHTLIAYMDETTADADRRKLAEMQNFTNGIGSELYALKPSTYIVAGPVPWQFVLALLAIWAFTTSVSGLWMLVLARPRWAPTLSAYEMFKFGARYEGVVDQFTSVDFQANTLALRKIPGMVGLLSGTGIDRPVAGEKSKPYLMGLSEVPLGKELQTRTTEFTFDRARAARRKGQ